MSTDWIRLDVSQFQRERHERGVSFITSPYNIPMAFRCVEDPSTADLVIEFKYIDEGEPVKESKITDEVAFRSGKKSNRLFQIRVTPVGKRNIPEAFQGMMRKLEEYKKAAGVRTQDNYAATQQVIVTHRNEILQPA